MSINVSGHRILIKPLKASDVDPVFAKAKALGIEFLDKDESKLRDHAVDRGVVLQVGATAYKDFGGEPWCAVGDEVFFARYSGKFLKDPYGDEKEQFILLNDEDILAVVGKE